SRRTKPPLRTIQATAGDLLSGRKDAGRGRRLAQVIQGDPPAANGSGPRHPARPVGPARPRSGRDSARRDLAVGFSIGRRPAPAPLSAPALKVVLCGASPGTATSVAPAQVLAIAEGAMTAMFKTKLKTATVLFLGPLILVGVILVASGESASAARAEQPTAAV